MRPYTTLAIFASGFFLAFLVATLTSPKAGAEPVEPAKPEPPMLKLVHHEACTIGNVESTRTLQLSDGSCWLIIGESPNPVRLFTKARITDPWVEVPPAQLPRIP